MARDGRSLLGRVLEEGTRLASKAAERVLSDPRGQDAVARAIGLAQRTKERVEALQAAAMRATGIPARQDYQELVKQLARIKRKARELSEQLEAERRGAAPAERDAAPGAKGGTGRSR